MRKVSVQIIKERMKEIVQQINLEYPSDVKEVMEDYAKKESNPQAKEIFRILDVNAKLAKEKRIPVCQDTGMVIVFLKIGQQVQFVDGFLKDTIHQGIEEGYQEGYLRKSIVEDPLFERVNTKTNTPAVIHYEIIEGDQIELEVGVKGFGSENMSRLYMLKPSDGVEGVKNVVLETIQLAGPNACPPLVVGVGIGGTFEKSAILAKKATFRSLYESHKDERYAKLEEELTLAANELNIGPQGLGGDCSVLKVNIESFPTHIAGLPIAVNISCHITRHYKELI